MGLAPSVHEREGTVASQCVNKPQPRIHPKRSGLLGGWSPCDHLQGQPRWVDGLCTVLASSTINYFPTQPVQRTIDIPICAKLTSQNVMQWMPLSTCHVRPVRAIACLECLATSALRYTLGTQLTARARHRPVIPPCASAVSIRLQQTGIRSQQLPRAQRCLPARRPHSSHCSGWASRQHTRLPPPCPPVAQSSQRRSPLRSMTACAQRQSPRP